MLHLRPLRARELGLPQLKNLRPAPSAITIAPLAICPNTMCRRCMANSPITTFASCIQAIPIHSEPEQLRDHPSTRQSKGNDSLPTHSCCPFNILNQPRL